VAEVNKFRKTIAGKLSSNRAGLVLLILGLSLLLLPSQPIILAKSSTPSEPRSINELVSTLDIQIQGWQRLGNPKASPVMDKDDQVRFRVDVKFTRENIQTITITLANYQEGIIDKLMAKVSKEHSQTVHIKDFEAIKVTSPPSIYEEYVNSLYIKVSDQSMLIIIGKEIMDFEELVKVANMIDLKKLAELTK
jgi:hypothetical protein